MTINRLIATALLLFLSAPLFAQTTIGLEGGFCYNTWQTNISNRAATRLSGGGGYTVGLPIRHSLNSWLGFTAVPELLQKGYSLNRTDSLSGEFDRHRNTYLQLPLGLSFTSSLGRFHFHLDPGLFGGYWLSGRVNGRTANIFSASQNVNAGQSTEQFQLAGYDQPYSFDPRRDNRWEAGWWAGCGIQYQPKSPWWIDLDVRYYQDLTSQEKSSSAEIPAYNRTWALSVGITWALHTSKSIR